MTKKLSYDEVTTRLDVKAQELNFTYEMDAYVNIRQRIKCVCNVCGSVRNPSIHQILNIYKVGCRKCAYAENANKRRLTLSQARQRLQEVSNNRYSFTMRTYEGCNQRIQCKCNTCGYEFNTEYRVLMEGQGCRVCGWGIKTYDDVLKSLNGACQGRYTFKFDTYISMHQQVECECSKCQYKWTTSLISLVYQKSGCAMCSFKAVGLKKRPSLDTIKQKLTEASQGRYTFSINIYENDLQKIKCKCNKCGYEWSARVGSLIRTKSGCRVCAMSAVGDQKRFTLTEAQQKLTEASQNRYTFELTVYKNNSQKIKCKCNGCDYEWNAGFLALVAQKSGCPNRCYRQLYKSNPENEIVDYINQSSPHLEVQQSVRRLVKNIHTGKALEIDIYIPELRLAFEFNGTYWHSDGVITKKKRGFTSAQQYHDYKTEQCALKGVKLVHIDEQCYKDNKQNVLDFILKVCCYRAVALNIDILQSKKQVA